MKSHVLILLFFSLPIVSYGQSPFFQNLDTGRYSVGFKTIQLQDHNRTYGDSSRPLLISVWYPAIQDDREKVYFRDYVHLASQSSRLSPLTNSQRSEAVSMFKELISRRGAVKEQLDELLSTATLARYNLSPITTKPPLLIVLQGGGRPAYTQFILNEFLASHGYLVASISDIRSHPDRQQTTGLSNARTLSEDIDLILDELKELTNGQKAILGFSKAGDAILLNQLVHKAFDTMIMLDAQPDQGFLDSLDLDKLSKITTPTLTVFSNHQNHMTLAEAEADSTAFEMLGGKRLKLRLMQANHGDLTVAAVLGEMIPGYNRWKAFGDSRRSYETLCRTARYFLDHNLMKVPSEQKVKELLSGLPGNFTVMHKLR